MSIGQTLLPEFDEEMTNTRKILALVPEDRFAYQPHQKSMTLGRLAGHVAEMPGWAKTIFEIDTLKIEPGQRGFQPESREELLKRFDDQLPEARTLLGNTPDELFSKTWTLQFGGKTVFSRPRGAVYRSIMMNHMIHHRAQLGVYLRLLEIEIPGMYGPSADEAKYWLPPAA